MSSGGSTRIIRIVLTGDSAGLQRAFVEADAAGAKTESSMQRVQAVGRGMTSVGRSMTMVAVPLVALGVYAVKTAASFQSSMTMIRTQVGASTSEVTNMSAQILKLAPKVGEGPNALAQALYPIESVGLRGASALSALRAASMGAQVSGANLTDTADALAGALGVGFKDVRTAADAMSILNATTAQGKMHLQDLVVALGTGVGVEAKRAGLGLREVGDALAAMTRQGIPAVDEATRLKLNLIQFEAPKNAALRALESIRLGQFSLANDLRKPEGLITALSDLRQHLQGVSKDQQNLVLSQAFGGAKGSANVAGLLNALPQMQQISQPLQAAGQGQLTSAFAERTKNLTFQWQRFKAIASVALVGLGNSLMPLVEKYLPKFAKFLEGVAGALTHMSPTMRDVVVGFTLLLAVGGPILMFLGSLITVGAAVIEVVGAVAGVVAGVAAAVTLAGALIGVAFVAIGVVIYELVTHFQQVKQGIAYVWNNLGSILAAPFVALWSVIKAPFQSVLNFVIGGIDLVIRALNFLIRQYDSVVGSIPFLGGGLTIGTIGQIAPVNFGSQSSGYKLNSSQKVGSQPGNSNAQTGSVAGGHAPIILKHTTRLGTRILTEEIVHFSAKRTSLGGGVLAH